MASRPVEQKNAADKPDSQDFYSGEREELIGEPDRPGHIVDQRGKVLGNHTGFWKYTLGQRKGLCISNPEPLYVIELNACRNEVVLGTREDLACREMRVEGLAWVGAAPSGTSDHFARPTPPLR